MTLSQQYPFILYATTPGGHQFSVARYPTHDTAVKGASKHMAAHPSDTITITDTRHVFGTVFAYLDSGMCADDCTYALATRYGYSDHNAATIVNAVCRLKAK